MEAIAEGEREGGETPAPPPPPEEAPKADPLATSTLEYMSQVFLSVVGPTEESLKEMVQHVEKDTARSLLAQVTASPAPPRYVEKRKAVRPRARELLERVLARMQQIETAVVKAPDAKKRFEKPAPPDPEEVAVRTVLACLALDATLAGVPVPGLAVGRALALATLAALEGAESGPADQPDGTGPAVVYDLLLGEFARAAAEPGLVLVMKQLEAAVVRVLPPPAAEPLVVELIGNLRAALASSGPVARALDSIVATAAARQVLLEVLAQRLGLSTELAAARVGKTGPTLGLVGLANYIASIGKAIEKARAPPPKPEEGEAKS